MGKALGIDYGTRRTGLAITDELQMIASPLEGVDTPHLDRRINELVATGGITDFVVGDPAMYGEDDSHSSDKINAFCEKLKKAYPHIPIHRVDESFSSREAMQAMVSGGMRKSKRRDKKTLDMVSATVILQRWLETSP